MIRNIIVGLVVLIVVLLLIGLMLPRTVQISRSVVINAPPSSIFAVVDGFRQFERWSPWAEKDPNLKVEISGPPFGVGAHYSWSGNKDVGSGTQEIIESHPYTDVKTRLTFSGFDQPSVAVMSLEPLAGQGTHVTWALHSDLGGNPLWHYFGLLMDKMVGPDYERGLAHLKTLVESQAKTDFGALQVERVDLQPQTIVSVAGSATTDVDAIGKALGAAYGKVGVAMKAAGLKQVAAPVSITRRYDEVAKVYEFDAGIPVDRADASLPADGPAKLTKTYAGLALKVQHQGPYATLGKTYELIDAFKKAYGLQDNGDSWEQYVDDPTTTPAAEVKTLIFVPVK
ncbi:MAG: hypothetical protein JWR16_3399 [Nevskia sp.]|nr:hypothetical protein [Nevskia sp.]